MRKSNKKFFEARTVYSLQCGRIYKDAEITLSIHALARHVLLQCGRIYKDAEINYTRRRCRPCIGLQCGRIYKDAEMRRDPRHDPPSVRLQCGRIYKDAEIIDARGRMFAEVVCFNVAASIKMRK